ncbi:MAG TPA: hypothetical protein VN878_00895 [Usitatibacter sp.]|nr:hypothetical protein [Usitatibacter sp.]
MKAMRRQQGFTLLVGLIMLVLMTLFAVTAFNLGKSSLQIVGNMQQHNQVLAAAQGAIEDILSKQNFFNTPNAVWVTPCKGPNTKCFDTNGSGKNDVVVTLVPAPRCVQASPIQNAQLNLALPQDVGCAVGTAQTFGVVGAATGASLCSNSVWEIVAKADDAVTQSTATITQGVSVRVSTDNIAQSCP